MQAGMIGIFKKHLEQGLQEDQWQWDFTGIGSGESQKSQTAHVIAKSNGIFVGEALCSAAELLAKDLGLNLQVKPLAKDGSKVQKKLKVVKLSGDPRAVLAFERPLLNLMAYLSGVATQTAAVTQKIKTESKKKKLKQPPRLTLTRKTLPYYRDLCIDAVIAGGGHPHRVSLSGGILIKENHIAAAGGVLKATQGVRAVAPHGLKIEIEVRNFDELSQALDAGVEAVLLDNFSPSQVKKAVSLIQRSNSKVVVEVSGGITEKNISSYIIPGVDVISMGGLTHTVQPLDLSLLMDGVK